MNMEPKVKRLALFYAILFMIPTLALIGAINLYIWYLIAPDAINEKKAWLMEKICPTEPKNSYNSEQLAIIKAYKNAIQMWPVPFTTAHYTPFIKSKGLNTNDLGYRGTKNYYEQIALAKDVHLRGGKVVVVTGGSAAFGAVSSSDEKCIVGLLNKYAKRDNKDIVFFNFAMGYYTSNEELAALVFYASALHPDLLIDINGFNDLIRVSSSNTPEFNRTPFMYPNLVNILHEQVLLPPPSEQYFLLKSVHPDDHYVNQVLESYRMNIQAMIGIMKFSGGKCIFLTQPVRSVMNNFEYLKVGGFREDQVKLAAALKRLAHITEMTCRNESACYYLNILNIFSNIRQEDANIYMLDNCHMTDTGQQALTEKLYPVVIKMLKKRTAINAH